MNKVESLIVALKKCIPELDIVPLQTTPPVNLQPLTVLDWLYENLSSQGVMVYEEWSEYNGSIPRLKRLSDLPLTEDPAAFIYSAIEDIDWSTASIDPAELPYVMPWLEHINFYLKPHAVRLVNLIPCENAYMLCVQDDETLLQQLHSSLEAFDIGINARPSMDQQQVLADINEQVSG